MAEAILNSFGAAHFHGFSAGALRAAPIKSDVVDFLAFHHMPVTGLRSKTLDNFRQPDAPRMNFIITLCDSAADRLAEWPDYPFIARWNVENSEAVTDSEDALRDTFWTLMRRIKIFTSLPHGKLNRRILEHRVRTLQASYL